MGDNLWKLLNCEIDFSEALYKEQGFHLLSGCNGNLEIFEKGVNFSQIIIDIISEYRCDYDSIILDSPAGLSQDNLILNAYADERIVVVTPDRSSITDSYSLVKLLNQKFGIKENSLLVNKYKTHKQFSKVVLTLSETIENFLSARTNIIGGIPYLNQFGDEFDNYFLFKEKSSFHQTFFKLVERFSERIYRRSQATIQTAYS
jgi:flagellar biosynthesis protein FlhG